MEIPCQCLNNEIRQNSSDISSPNDKSGGTRGIYPDCFLQKSSWSLYFEESRLQFGAPNLSQMSTWRGTSFFLNKMWVLVKFRARHRKLQNISFLFFLKSRNFNFGQFEKQKSRVLVYFRHRIMQNISFLLFLKSRNFNFGQFKRQKVNFWCNSGTENRKVFRF